MGYNKEIYDSEKCSANWAYNCYPSSLPSGTQDNPTRLLGENWNLGCNSMPELYGVEGVLRVLNLNESDYTEVQCLEITDHEACVNNANHSTRACYNAGFPVGDWAKEGMYVYNSTNVTLNNINIHGIANNGIKGSKLTDFKSNYLTLRANGIAGWNGTAASDNSSSGTLSFHHLLVEYNGCIESYPSKEPEECWAQQGGGYGDGFGLDATAGNWEFIDSAFKHNTSDGLDGLYLFAGSSMRIERVHSEGNAGSQVKVSGDKIWLLNSKLVGNCNFFSDNPITAVTEWDNAGDSCRAGGPPINLAMTRGSSTGHEAVVLNNTVVWESNYGLWLSESVGTCSGTEEVYVRNTIFQSENNKLNYIGVGCTGLTPDVDFIIAHNTYGSPCNGVASCSTDNPKLAQVDFEAEKFNLNLLEGSPAINNGLESNTRLAIGVIPDLDFYGNTRTDTDIGAHEYSITSENEENKGDILILGMTQKK